VLDLAGYSSREVEELTGIPRGTVRRLQGTRDREGTVS
jgi:hypothetical protein